jgi:hypothetical protein
MQGTEEEDSPISRPCSKSEDTGDLAQRLVKLNSTRKLI